MGSNSFDSAPRSESMNLTSESQSAKKGSVDYDSRQKITSTVWYVQKKKSWAILPYNSAANLIREKLVDRFIIQFAEIRGNSTERSSNKCAAEALSSWRDYIPVASRNFSIERRKYFRTLRILSSALLSGEDLKYASFINYSSNIRNAMKFLDFLARAPLRLKWHYSARVEREETG